MKRVQYHFSAASIGIFVACCVSSLRAFGSDGSTYDLSRDFSIASNPNGVWSYGWKSTLEGPLTLLTVPRSYAAGSIPIEDWVLADNQVPQVQHNASSNLVWQTGEGTFPPGIVILHAGFDGSPQNYCLARFVAPAAGSYRLQSAVESRLSGASSRDADYFVVVNSQTTFGTNLPPNSRAEFRSTLELKAGDKVEFATGRGPDGAQFGSGIKIEATLTELSCTPHKAKATAQLVNGFVVVATITDPGCGYTNPPIVLVQGGGGSGATARATVTDGRVTRVQIVDAGCCYTNTPRIVISSPPSVPTVEVVVSKVKVVQNVVLGWKYVLESSTNATDWTSTGPAFIAETDPLETEFESNRMNRFFRLRVVP